MTACPRIPQRCATSPTTSVSAPNTGDGTALSRTSHDDTLLAVVTSLASPGRDITDDEDLARLRSEHGRAPWSRTVPPVTVLRTDQDSSVPVHVEHGTAVTAHLLLESGGRRDLEQVEDHTPPVELDGRLLGRARFRLPAGLPLGWHQLVASTADGRHEGDVVVTPETLTTHEPFAARRATGLQAQLYSVRSDRSWDSGTSPICVIWQRSSVSTTGRTSCW